jgi:hypothetical protein
MLWKVIEIKNEMKMCWSIESTKNVYAIKIVAVQNRSDQGKMTTETIWQKHYHTNYPSRARMPPPSLSANAECICYGFPSLLTRRKGYNKGGYYTLMVT